MLSSPVHKDLTKYRPKIVAGLSSRTLSCVALAVGVAVGLGCYFWFVLGIPYDNVSFLVYAASMPFWGLAFWRPSGMTPEEWLPLWWRQGRPTNRLSYDNAERYRSWGLLGGHEDAAEDESPWRHGYLRFARHQRGIELWEPSQGHRGEEHG
ncbi:PrgI family protein [Olsenella profusa]|uniref:PrgI family protein n=1 Tax=Olsenella profusa F0195 TaxID=1125712 RepID=U2T0X8_9ACTN|nr:PrgI family protein [Olsenella profusa]ERL06709.1 PrgI family protein [Olsenella profusa F0195]